MTRLTKKVYRVANKKIGKKHVVITLVPGSDKREELIGLRLMRTKTQYLITLSDLYRLGAMWYANKEKAARSAARKAGIPWKEAKKQFIRDNAI